MKAFRIFCFAVLSIISTSATACPSTSVSSGQPMPFGLHFTDGVDQVMCSIKSSEPKATFRWEFSSRDGSCRGNTLRQVVWKISDYDTFDSLFQRSNSELNRLLPVPSSSANKVIRDQYLACYRLNDTRRVVDVVRDSSIPDQKIALIDVSVTYQNIDLFGVKGNLTPFFTSSELGLAKLLADLEQNRSVTSFALGAVNHASILTLSGLDFVSAPTTDAAALARARREALPIFQKVLSQFPGQISQDEKYDLIITNNIYRISMSFSEATGSITMSVRNNPEAKYNDVIHDPAFLEKISWVGSHRIQTR